MHCDALSANRWNSQRFLSVFQRFVPHELHRDYAWELAVCLRTKGFALRHWKVLFDWEGETFNRHVPVVRDYFQDVKSVQVAADDNAASISQADGLAWLMAVLEVNPNYRGSVPLWTQLALCGLHDDGAGMTDAEIGQQVFGGAGLPGRSGRVGVGQVVQRWRSQWCFDPLTGRELEEGGV